MAPIQEKDQHMCATQMFAGQGVLTGQQLLPVLNPEHLKCLVSIEPRQDDCRIVALLKTVCTLIKDSKRSRQENMSKKMFPFL